MIDNVTPISMALSMAEPSEPRPDMEARLLAEERAEQERQRVAALIAACGMPPELLKSKTFANFEVNGNNREAFQTLNAWRPTDDWGVMLQGFAGTGKTHLMLGFANKWIAQQVPIFFQSLTEMFDDLREGYSNGKYRPKMDALKAKQVLVLDDLGAEKPTDWVEEKLFQLLDHRMNHSLPTFFTTNCKNSELKERLHERVTSRIRDMAVIRQVLGEDRRNKKYESRLLEIERRIKGGK